MGFGNNKKITAQHAAPASIGTHVVSALPAARMTFHNADTAPKQTGNRKIAIRVLAHLGMTHYLEDRRREARYCSAELHSAVSPSCTRLAALFLLSASTVPRFADCKSAIQQNAILRYNRR